MRAKLVLLLVAGLLVWVAPANAFPRPAPGEVTLTMDDGVTLACGFQHSDQPFLLPAVILFHGLGGTHQSLDPIARTFASQGYATLACDARGQGASGGFFDLDGPRTVADVRAQLEWLDSVPGIDGARIGAWGISLGGGAVLNSAAAGVPWAAVETVETWSDLYSALVPNDLPKTGAIFLFSRGIPDCAYTPELRSLLQDALAARNLPAIRSFLETRSSLSRLTSVATPTYLFQGRQDFAFDIDQAMRAYKSLRGPKKLYIGSFGHAPSTFPGPDLPYVLSEGVAWFDRHLKGMPNGVDSARQIQIAPVPFAGTPEPLPPPRAVKLTLRGSSTIGAAGKVVRTVQLPRGSLETFGAPVVRARLSGSFSHVVAVLEADGKVVSEGGAALRPSSTPRWVTFRLIADAVRLRARSLKLTLAATSTAQHPSNLLYIVGVNPGQRLRVGTVQVTLPVLEKAVSP